VLILAYHRVQPEPAETLSVSTRNFERQLRWLLAAGWQPSVLDEAHHRGRKFSVTFDDGYRDNILHAVPILLKLGIPAAFFVSTAYFDDEQVFYWRRQRMPVDDVEGFPLRRCDVIELVRAGFEVGSHTVTHPHLTELCDEEVRDELRSSRRDIEDLTGRACRFLVYPFASTDERVIAEASRAGFRDAFLTPTGPHLPNRRFSRHRIGVYRHDSLGRFALKASMWYRVGGLRRIIWKLPQGREPARS
jgi:peptidoglycan/xylan/chitin deacetylase (PgdA/CDA1 family)